MEIVQRQRVRANLVGIKGSACNGTVESQLPLCMYIKDTQHIQTTHTDRVARALFGQADTVVCPLWYVVQEIAYFLFQPFLCVCFSLAAVM